MRNPNSSHPYRIPAILALMAVAAILAFATVMTVSAQSNDPRLETVTHRPERHGRRCGRRVGHHLGRPPPDQQDPVRLPCHLDARRRVLQDQRPYRMVRLSDHQPGQ